MRNKIKVGQHVYGIRYVNTGHLLDSFGCVTYNDMQILLDNSIPKSKRQATLAHEILHILVEESGARELLRDQEELLVRMLENTFYSFLVKNTNFYEGEK